MMENELGSVTFISKLELDVTQQPLPFQQNHTHNISDYVYMYLFTTPTQST